MLFRSVRLVGNTFLACKTATLAQSGGSFVQLGQAQAQAEYLAAFGVELPESVFGGEPPVVPPEPDPIDPEPSGEPEPPAGNPFADTLGALATRADEIRAELADLTLSLRALRDAANLAGK